MPQYVVARKELWIQIVHISADTKEEAKLKVDAGYGTVQDDPRYSANLDIETWSVVDPEEG